MFNKLVVRLMAKRTQRVVAVLQEKVHLEPVQNVFQIAF